VRKLWGVVAVGVLLGFTGGLIFTWFLSPLTYMDTYPPMLAPRYRQDWARMAVWAYAMEENRDRTQVRLLNLPRSEVATVAAEVLDRAVVQGHPIEVLQSIARLAADYGAAGPGVMVYLESAGTLPFDPLPVASPTSVTDDDPTVTRTSTTPPVTATAARPRRSTSTPTPLPTLELPIRIISQTLTCELSPRIAISLEMSRTVVVRRREVTEQVGLPMREVWLIWESGSDRAITGFRPEIGLGYADFDVEPGHVYNLYIDSPTGPPVLTVQVEPCLPAEGEGWVSRVLVLLEESRPEEATPTGTPTLTPTLTPTPTVTPVLRLTPTPRSSE
jgi:hypothetical protein